MSRIFVSAFQLLKVKALDFKNPIQSEDMCVGEQGRVRNLSWLVLVDDNKEAGASLYVCRHMIGFFLFLALTIYTVREVPKEAVLPERVANMLHMPNRNDMHQLHVELVTCFPSLATVPSFLQEHLPQIMAKCIPDTPVILANSTHECFMVHTQATSVTCIGFPASCSSISFGAVLIVIAMNPLCHTLSFPYHCIPPGLATLRLE